MELVLSYKDHGTGQKREYISRQKREIELSFHLHLVMH